MKFRGGLSDGGKNHVKHHRCCFGSSCSDHIYLSQTISPGFCTIPNRRQKTDRKKPHVAPRKEELISIKISMGGLPPPRVYRSPPISPFFPTRWDSSHLPNLRFPEDSAAFVSLSSLKSKDILGALGCYARHCWPTSHHSSWLWGFQASQFANGW